MDKATLNILSLVIGGTGIFVALTKFNMPELRMSFFGENPFSIKRDAIDNVMSWIFASLALVGLLIQVCSEILDHRLPGRLHATCFYVSLFIIAVAGSAILVALLTAAGRWIARRFWQPTIIEKLTEAYHQTRVIIEQDGWRQDQVNIKDTLPDPDHYRQANFNTATETIAQIETLLEIASSGGDLKERLEKLSPYFNQH